MSGASGKRAMDTKVIKPYEKPIIRTYTEDELIDLIGPANTAGSPFFGEMPGNSSFGRSGGHGHGH